MKTLALGFALAIASAGCLGSFVPNPQPGAAADLGADGGGTGSNGSHDSSTDMATLSQLSNDLAGVTPGTKAFGELCTVPGDCQSLLCDPFAMGAVHRCTKTCTVATQTADCPVPSAATCTNNGYCKFTQ